MFVVGLTGGIGSGKSAVASRLSQLGIPVIDADLIAREVVAPGEPALEKIARRFGAGLLRPDGTLDRAALRQIVFANEKARTWLEQLLHPLIRDRILSRIEENASAPYTLLASPLLLETDQHLLVNHVVVVDVPESEQISRTMARDQNTEAQVRAILAAQMGREERCRKADSLIDNSAGLDQLEQAVADLHQRLLQAAKEEAEDA